MGPELRSLAARAAEQHGVVSRRQAARLGVTRWSFQRAVAGGVLHPAGRRAWRFAGTPPSWRGQLQAGLFDLGPQALVAGRSAAALLGLDGFDEGPLEFVIPRSRRGRLTHGVVRTTSRLEPTDRRAVDGLACTSAALTVIQLAGFAGRNATANALDSAIRLRLASTEQVVRRLTQARASGVAGVELIDELLVDAGVESWLERRFLALLRSAGLPQPALQRVYRRDGRHVARVDFDFAPWPVIVEVGGQKGYLTTRERQRQERRRNELHLRGKTVYFFSYEDVTEEPAYVAGTVRSALDATSRAAS
jgi:very-short-patch-repair endonuclease